MGENSKIEWCDHTMNFWMGCTKVGPGCDFCYAEEMMDHRYGRVKWGAGENRVRTSASYWNEPLKWDRAAASAGKSALVFCLSLGDIWDNEVDPAWRREAFEIMEKTPHLIYLLLSKRIGNAIDMCMISTRDFGKPIFPRNAALGATMVNQEEWDRDLPKLLHATKTLGARFVFASVEPMLGPIDARGMFPDQVIVGGESGPNARPIHPDWVRNLRDECAASSVPFLFKQWGEWLPGEVYAEDNHGGFARHQDGTVGKHGGKHDHWWSGDAFGGVISTRVGKKAAGRLLDGIEHNGYPKGIRR